jgi:pimeloyl-ACP methyl ester carboxylesterase
MRVRRSCCAVFVACLGLAATPAASAGDGDAPFRAEVRVANLPRTSVAWYERGQGQPLVMLTGTGSTMAEWDPALLRLLARRHRLILFDYPGVGLSGPWRGRTFAALAQTTAELIKAIHLGRADVLGWSMGGFVAQRRRLNTPVASPT